MDGHSERKSARTELGSTPGVWISVSRRPSPYLYHLSRLCVVQLPAVAHILSVASQTQSHSLLNAGELEDLSCPVWVCCLEFQSSTGGARQKLSLRRAVDCGSVLFTTYATSVRGGGGTGPRRLAAQSRRPCRACASNGKLFPYASHSSSGL